MGERYPKGASAGEAGCATLREAEDRGARLGMHAKRAAIEELARERGEKARLGRALADCGFVMTTSPENDHGARCF